MNAQLVGWLAILSVTIFGCGFALVIKRLLLPPLTPQEGAHARLSGDYYKPLTRMLSGDVAEVGFTPRQAKNLRSARRRVFRRYLVELQADFLTLHQEARLLLRDSEVDRPDLAVDLVKNYALFQFSVLRAHGRLAALGMDLPQYDVNQLLDSVRWMHRQVEMLQQHAAPQPI